MCGRYTISADQKRVADYFGVDLSRLSLKPRYNIAPGQEALVVHENRGKRLGEMMRWGLIPSWAKEESIGHKMINARAETLLEKPSFRQSFLQRRCAIAADGFYEWQKAEDRKRPLYIFLKGHPVFAFAGLWDRWLNPQGKEIHSFTIITTGSNELLQPVHERMPVILYPEDVDVWLDTSLKDENVLKDFLKPYDSDLMDYWEVTTTVNSPRTDSPDCIQSISIGPPA